MNWFSLALALLSIVKAILEMVERRRAENAAEAAVLLRMMKDADDELKAIGEASAVARARARSGGLSDDDFRD